MTTGSTSTAPEDRDDVVQLLLGIIGDLKMRIDRLDPETTEDDRLYLEHVRTLGQLAGQYRLLTRDTDIDEMQDRLELLQEAEAIQSGDR